MKKFILIVCLFTLATAAKAQYNYSEWGVGASYSSIKPYSDLKQNNIDRSFSAQVYYNYSPYVPFAFEAQFGKLSGGNNVTDPSHRYFSNSFLSFNLHGDVQLGEIIDYDNNFFMQFIKGFYLGTGLGLTANNITSIRRNALDVPDYVFPGSDHTINAIIPIRLGYEIKFFNYNDEPFMTLNLGYIHNLTFAEGMDGYDDPSTKFKNNAQDMFRQITVGVKFNFGNPVSYIKSIR